jgi:hypothetical protein
MSIRTTKGRLMALTLTLCTAFMLAGLSQLASCQKPSFDQDGKATSSARRITSRSELIGGPGALGEVGDFLLENDKIRVIIQDKGYSRGFGVYGGGLTDADIVRPVHEASVLEAHGQDQFGELFPIFFLQAMNPDDVSVVNDGTESGNASVNVRGYAGNFLTMADTINQLMMNSNVPPWDPEIPIIQKLQYLQDAENFDGEDQLQYDVTYSLVPGKNFVEITTRLTNITEEDLAIPSEVAGLLMEMFVPEMERLDVPMGYVILYGAGNKAFTPGFGYNIRFALEDRYSTVMPFPALSGLITDGLISTSANGVSYGFFGAKDGVNTAENFAKNRFDENGVNLYEKNFGDKVEDESLLVPFLASSFTGVFYAQAPAVLPTGDFIEFKNYFVVGNGDAASVIDAMYGHRKEATDLVQGKVHDIHTLLPVHKASVVIFDAEGRPINQAYTDDNGYFKLHLPAGDYSARVEKDPVLSEPVSFTVEAGSPIHLELSKPGTMSLSVRVSDSISRPLPAKVTVISRYTEDEVQAVRDGLRTWEFLFDLSAGQHWRISDQIPDDPDDASTMQFIEAIEFTEEGHAHLELPTGRSYEVFVSRGTEYNVQTFDIAAADTKPGAGISFNATLKRVVDTSGYISADYHIHASPSLDSDVGLHDRVVSGAAEGLECLVATDHNVITDYAPAIEKAGLTEWTSSMIGLELTTLEAGHFNGFPLSRDKSEITKGSFEWSDRAPKELFQDLRDLGAISPEKTLIQVNHARDSILGYFAQYDVDELSGERADLDGGFSIGNILSAGGSAFFDSDGNTTLTLDDADFHIIEVINGPIRFQTFHGRMPENIDGVDLDAEIVSELPEPGTILCDDGKVAFPGVVDDWFNLLNLGETFTGVANSDSHHENNLGYPRTYVAMGTDDPTHLDQEAMVDALKAQKATMSNGPFLEFWVNGEPIGARIDDSDGTVDLKIRVQAPDWVEVNKLTIVVNGLDKIVETFEMENGSFTWEKELQLNRDSWIVAIVTGEKSMFPVVVPKDVPPFQLSDAFSTLAGPLGFGSSKLSPLAPKRTGPPLPLGVSNPIWVNVDSNAGFDPPGIVPRKCVDYGVVHTDPGERSSGLQQAPRRMPLRGSIRNSFGFPRIHGDKHDIRSIFEAHIGHSHPH